jgi:hypothetical protein
MRKGDSFGGRNIKEFIFLQNLVVSAIPDMADRR